MDKLEILFQEKYGAIRGSQTKLAKDLNITQGTVACWINKTRKPSKDLILKMAKLFGKTEEQIKEVFSDEQTPILTVEQLSNLLNQLPQKDTQHIREVLNIAQVKTPPVTAIVSGNIVTFTEDNSIPSEGCLMEFKVKAADTTPLYKQGDIMIFDTAAAPKHGSLVITENNGVYTIVAHNKNTTGRVIATAIFKSI